jgi:hypothetical protein
MIKLLLLVLLPFSLYASKILSYNVYDRTDRVDIMLTFDTPYKGIIKQNTTKSKILITLENATIESAKNKRISSKFLQKISIIPLSNKTQIIAYLPASNIQLQASKTIDGYGLRLRFTTKAIIKNEENIAKEDSLSVLPTKKGNDISNRYYIVISILIIGLFILLYLKRKVQPNNTKPSSKQPWLFQSTTTTKTEKNNTSDEAVTIRFQKVIDSDNSVVMLDFVNQSYLVLMGKNNILLDKFTDNQPSSQQEFDSILQNRHDELEAFLSHPEKETREDIQKQEPLQAYKERAASLLYSDN